MEIKSQINNILNEHNLTLADLEKEFEGELVILYSSKIEGLGTKDSDIDVYVIKDSIADIEAVRTFPTNKVVIKQIKGLNLDIEYWEYNTVKRLIDENSSEDMGKVDLNSLKIIQRFKIGYMFGPDERKNELNNMIIKFPLKKQTYKYFKLLANSELDDAVSLLNANYLFSALKCMRNALDYSIACYNTIFISINLKEKWIPTILEKALNEDNYLVEEYKNKILCDSSKPLQQQLTDMASLIQNILSECEVENEW